MLPVAPAFRCRNCHGIRPCTVVGRPFAEAYQRFSRTSLFMGSFPRQDWVEPRRCAQRAARCRHADTAMPAQALACSRGHRAINVAPREASLDGARWLHAAGGEPPPAHGHPSRGPDTPPSQTVRAGRSQCGHRTARPARGRRRRRAWSGRSRSTCWRARPRRGYQPHGRSALAGY